MEVIQLTAEQARTVRSEGVMFWPLYDDKTHELIGWKTGMEGGGEAHAPIETFQWVPHEPKTWPWRFATLKKPLTMRVWNKQHPVEENTTEKVLPPGTTVKLVMVSRLGDAGFTDDLTAHHGYHVRIDRDQFDDYFEKMRNEP
jgi:hypothetical protein